MRNLALTLMVSAYAVSSVSASWTKYGDSYQAQSAAVKSDQLWTEITANPKTYGWYSSISLGGLFVESMLPTLQWQGDTFESGIFGPRSKYIHSVGNVGKVKFVPVENNEGYTGIFEGADQGFIRLSLAKKPDTSKKTAAEAYNNFAPGIALKFLRDGVESASMVAMYSVEGQDSWNFFKNDFTNHIPGTDDTALVILSKKFATGTPFV